MAHDPVGGRYAQALFEAATNDRAVLACLEELERLGWAIREETGLRQLLWNPDVDPDEKLGVLERALGSAWTPLMRAFVAMVVSMGRAPSLPEIAEAFRALVDEAEGRLRVVVRSAHPLPEALLERLRSGLARRETKRIELSTELDPTLLGGFQVQLGYRVIDGSVRRQLVELRQRLTSLRVH